MPGVRAIVALTPYSLPFQQSEGLRHIAAPIMYQAGALDPIFTIPLEQFGYAQTPKPKYMVEIAWASHMAWTDLGGAFGANEGQGDIALELAPIPLLRTACTAATLSASARLPAWTASVRTCLPSMPASSPARSERQSQT